MAAVPSRFISGEALGADADAPADVAQTSSRSSNFSSPVAELPRATRELTARALIVGCAIGAVLAAGNVYIGLKSSFIDGGALTAALLSFAFFATFKRLARIPFGPLENNVAQTAAASAAIMAFVHGLMGPVPAMMLMGHRHPAWALWLWGITLALIGLAIAVVLRRKLVVEDALPFPTGTATAELIRTVHAHQGPAARRTRLLVVAALAAAALTWLRDGHPALIPQALYLPITLSGLSGASLTLGIATSPLMAATGVFMGLRFALSLLVGGVIAWGIIGPIGVGAGWIANGNYATLASWLVWPAIGMILASTIVPFALGWREVGRVLLRTLRDARNLLVTSPRTDSLKRPSSRGRLAGVIAFVLASVVLAWTGWRAFGLSPLLTGAALLLSVLLAGACARAAGETDIAPVGQFGTIAQLLFAGGGPGSSLMSGAIVTGSASETAQAMWAFKAGHNLHASVRAQIVAQAAGAVIGSLVVVPVYLLIVRAYPLGSERMPAAVALSWKATAEALTGGLAGLPAHGLHALLISFGVGTLLCVLAPTRIGKVLPSAMALGIAMITPVSLSMAAVLGAATVAVARRRSSSLSEGDTSALAAGALAGESIVGVLIAVLTATGMLRL